jgi:lia operon protein LiaG
MKFNVKKFVLWITAFMFGCFITAGAIMAAMGNLSLAVGEVDESKTFKASEISEIYVDVASTDININKTDGEDILVNLSGEVSTNRKMEFPELAAYKNGDELHVEIRRPIGFIFGINIYRTRLDIYIPEDSLEVLEINTVSSDAGISNLNVGKLRFSSTSGDFNGRGITADSMELNSISGDFKLEDYTGDLDISTTSGDLVLKDGTLNKNIEIITISGDLYIEQEDPGDISIETTSGEVGINLSEDAEFFLKAKTVSGDIRNNFPIKITSSGRMSLEGIVGSEENVIEISTVSGNVSVDYR